MWCPVRASNKDPKKERMKEERKKKYIEERN
jgi:hypothetical protein